MHKSIDKAIDLIAEAAGQGAALIAFPEVWIPGYPWWIWTDAPATGMRFVQRYFENAMAPGSEPFQRLLDAAAQHRIHVVLGYVERSGGTRHVSSMTVTVVSSRVAGAETHSPIHVQIRVREINAGVDDRDINIYPFVQTVDLGRG